MKKKIVITILFFFFLITLFFLYEKIFKKEDTIDTKISTSEDISYNSNLINNVNYVSKDANGNEYIINAELGEIDYNNSDIIYLTNVKALIKLTSSNNITITSDFGKYNTNNFDTIFSKNVIIKYLENKIIGENLDFSIQRNSMIISRNVVYTNFENILVGDVIEIDIKTKDTKIFMYEKNKKVNIRSIK